MGGRDHCSFVFAPGCLQKPREAHARASCSGRRGGLQPAQPELPWRAPLSGAAWSQASASASRPVLSSAPGSAETWTTLALSCSLPPQRLETPQLFIYYTDKGGHLAKALFRLMWHKKMECHYQPRQLREEPALKLVTWSLGSKNYRNISLISGGFSLPGADDDFGSVSPGVPALLTHAEAGGFRLKKSLGLVCLHSCCAPDQLGPQASRLEKNNLSLLGEPCGLAEMVWGADWPVGKSLADARVSLSSSALQWHAHHSLLSVFQNLPRPSTLKHKARDP